VLNELQVPRESLVDGVLPRLLSADRLHLLRVGRSKFMGLHEDLGAAVVVQEVVFRVLEPGRVHVL